MNSTKTVKITRIVFAALIIAGLLSGFAHALFMPYTYSAYENRMMEQLPGFTEDSALSGEFQNQTESAMSDQIPFSSYFKKAYNVFNSKLILGSLEVLGRIYPEKAWNVGSMRIYDNRILYYRNSWESVRPGFDTVAESYSRAAVANSDVQFYCFYIETDTTYDPLTETKNPAYEYLCEKLALPDGHVSRLECSSLESFEENFFRTDHHWNGRGAYAGYTGIAHMLGIPDSELMTPKDKTTLQCEFFGTKAAGCGMDTMTESPEVLVFEYPEYGVQFGREQAYIDGTEREDFSYGRYYGGDEPEIVFDTGRIEKENILVIGDSYDNAVLKLIASHYNKTYSVDLRYYTQQLKISDYIKGKDISKILIIGSDFLYSDPTFCVGE